MKMKVGKVKGNILLINNNRKAQYKQRAPYNYIDNTVVIIFANAS